MSIRTVFLHAAAETLDTGSGAPHYACSLAHEFDAQLNALVLELDMLSPKTSAEQSSGADQLRRVANDLSLDLSVITERSHIHSTPEIAADHARLADIAVAGVREQGLLSERMVAEAIIFQSGRPVIIVPDRHPSGFAADRIMVAWDFSKSSARALSDALPFLQRASQVTLISFGGDKALSTCLSPDQVQTALRRRGVVASYRQVDRGNSDIGDAINATAIEAGADLLVMGGFGHSRFRDFVLGGATRRILAAPRLPTLISH